VVRTAGAIDPASRTLLTEVDVPNPKGEIMPGAYAQVAFHLKGGTKPLVIPSNTLIFRSAGAQIAVVENNHAHLRNVTIGRDFGANFEIASGLSDGEEVILNPPDSLTDGQPVQVQSPPPSPTDAGH
jgi:multidrug efflux pump subunit AcrA (membrane-fusion protein)